MSNILLKKLAERYTLNTNPDVATTVEQGLMQLSSGIYTEEERFIFELLQNAVDSYEEMTNDILTIKIMIEGDYLVFMHNGASFSPRDIEGICDIGNGNKAKDTKKIGYKGIGFKSVFMRSTCVTIKTGEYCFMFDKQYWEGFWERNWKKEYGIKSDEKVYLMPWQIIPIEANEPISLDTSNYNVITYIKITNTSSLEKKIVKLLSNSQFLLFLRCKNIQMTFVSNNVFLANVNKKCNDNIVILSSNGKEDSRWLTYTNPEVEVPKELNSDIKADINTPQKLKNAKTFDLSFAIQIDNNSKIKSLDKDDAVIYTYLPTSFKFGNEGFPFLVNANFITDAGRQQLHKDSEWNKLIFSKIPSEYLNWMKEISSTFSNYYEVLPKKSYCLFLNKVDTLKSTIMKKKEEQLQISLDRVKLQKHVYELCRVQKLTINEVRKKTGLGMGTIYRYLHTFEEENPKLVEQMKKQGPNIIPEDYKKLQEEVLRLKCELKREKLRADFYEEMVAFGKEVYGIDLKKAGTK